jgi:SAM-dependent methyltransferase
MSEPTSRREDHTGTGPGPITPDGCAVEMYLRLPPGDEADVIAGAAPPAASILELGSGVGRVTHALVERGFAVTAVDESPQMLEHVRGARTVCSQIESLRLAERFDVVLLPSFLVHAADPERRAALLRTCRAHVKDGGTVLVQREGADWHERVPREAPLGAGRVRVAASDPTAVPGVRKVHVEYLFPDATWTQTFTSRPLGRAEFESALAGEGLTVDGYLTDDGVWAKASPVTR